MNPFQAQQVFDYINTGLQGGEAALNYKNEAENRELQWKIQQENWKRDDNAVQRRAADLEAAGMAKQLAAGASATNTSSYQGNAPKLDISGVTGAARRGFETAVQRQVTEKNFASIDADIELKKAQAQWWRNDRPAQTQAQTSYTKTLEELAANNRDKVQKEIDIFDQKTSADINRTKAQTELMGRQAIESTARTILANTNASLNNIEYQRLSRTLNETIRQFNLQGLQLDEAYKIAMAQTALFLGDWNNKAGYKNFTNVLDSIDSATRSAVRVMSIGAGMPTEPLPPPQPRSRIMTPSAPSGYTFNRGR